MDEYRVILYGDTTKCMVFKTIDKAVDYCKMLDGKETDILIRHYVDGKKTDNDVHFNEI